MTTIFTPKETPRLPAAAKSPTVQHTEAVAPPKDRKSRQDRNTAADDQPQQPRRRVNPDDLTDEMLLKMAQAIGGKHGAIVDKRV